ncbi:MAG: SusD/RagB family nutrient-binding outer membrane lipoprotein [Sphingobacteriales bacterium]|nr:SusD/RagB family nutrient-binding outer membrane lipoprotein [Sphingobacteriales bacterium]
MMKKQFLPIFLTAIIVMVVMGCQKSFFDINTSPNSATNTTPELVLPQALTATAAGQIANYAFVSEWMGYWCPSGSYAVSASDLASYRQTTGFGDGIWQAYYHNLEDYDYIEQTATTQKKTFYQGAAIVMKAFVFQQLVDMFNNVPYTQALHGTNTIQPAYDDAKTIYESLAGRLDTAVTLLQRADAVAAANSDVLFNGSTTKWVQFANTLKLRILMRQSQMSGRASYIQAQIAKINANGGGFLSTDAGVNPGYANNSGQMNPFWSMCYNTAGTYIGDFWRANQYPITFCTNNNDPRYTRLYAPTANGGIYQGNVIGSQTNHAANTSSTFGPGVLKSVSQPAIILSAAESYFLQAEAGLDGWLSNTPQELFQNGVQASFTYLGAGDATSYYSQAGNVNTNYAACSGTAQQLACIIRQKWMAMNTVTPFEAWADYRRLGLPVDIPLSVSQYVDVLAIPVRILYPTSEYQTNGTNVNAQGTINHHTSKIFWMP